MSKFICVGKRLQRDRSALATSYARGRCFYAMSSDDGENDRRIELDSARCRIDGTTNFTALISTCLSSWLRLNQYFPSSWITCRYQASCLSPWRNLPNPSRWNGRHRTWRTISPWIARVTRVDPTCMVFLIRVVSRWWVVERLVSPCAKNVVSRSLSRKMEQNKFKVK